VRRLTARDPDVVSELLGALRVRSTVWCLSELTAPWAFAVEPREFSCFHLVVAGSGWLDVDGTDEPIRLGPGDLVVLPHGNGHAVRDDPRTPATLLDDLLESAPATAGRLRAGGGGASAEILCGGFALDGPPAGPLLDLVPPVLHVRGGSDWLQPTLALLQRELPARTPGADAVVGRLTDVLVTQAMRIFLASRDGVRALRDPWIARVLRAVQDDPERPWTLSELAGAAAMSRTAFAQRFRELTGMSPVAYVKRVRLARAAELLRTTELPVAEIAGRCGYVSPPSFSRAFARVFGAPPGHYRRAAPEAVGALTTPRAEGP
jgi:AraC-like DNA-binding protein/mannose-6-phosphate isomerase-like protein (cupin superfamily)